MNTEPNKAPINIIKTLVILFLSCSFSFAQGIPIQLMVVDGDGFEMPNKQVKLRLTLTNDTSLTTGQYQEVHSITTSDLGIASVELGSGITTSNSQTLDLGLFNFQEVEPFIKTELDTNLSPTQYIELGWMRYNYPLIAQRALRSDSSEYLINEKAEWYFDSSASNEIQHLYLDQGFLKLTESNDSIDLNTASGLQKTEDFCNYSEEYYYSASSTADTGVIDIGNLNDTLYVLRQVSRTTDSIFYSVEQKTSSSSSNLFFFKAPQNASYWNGRLFLRKNRIIIVGSEILVYSNTGNLIFEQVTDLQNRLIAIGDSIMFLTNSAYGTSFTIKFRNIYSGTVLSKYQSVCSGCVSRPLPTLGITSGDTAWINAYTSFNSFPWYEFALNERWYCYNGNLYQQTTGYQQPKQAIFDIQTNTSRFRVWQTGLLIINGKATTVPVDPYYSYSQTTFSLDNQQGQIRFRYLAKSSHLLFNRYYIEMPAVSGNGSVLIEVIFDTDGEVKSINKSFVGELRVDELSYTSILQFEASNCLNGIVNSSAILSR